MKPQHYAAVTLSAALFLSALACAPAGAFSAELRADTVEAFEKYVEATEARIDAELRSPDRYLYIDGAPETRRNEILAALKSGDVYMLRLKTLGPDGRDIRVPDGMIHHWLGAVFIPGATLSRVLALVQDYDRHQDIYKPEVVRSHLVSRHGDEFQIYYRLRKKKLITVTLDTDHDVFYYPVEGTRCHSRSYTRRIQEIEDADKPTEKPKPVGIDSGFLWRLYSYWKFEQKDGGVYVECESLSLTRKIPLLLSPLIKPFVTDIPKESLQMTMGSTRRFFLRHD
jgi:hypothetical protein